MRRHHFTHNLTHRFIYFKAIKCSWSLVRFSLCVCVWIWKWWYWITKHGASIKCTIEIHVKMYFKSFFISWVRSPFSSGTLLFVESINEIEIFQNNYSVIILGFHFLYLKIDTVGKPIFLVHLSAVKHPFCHLAEIYVIRLKMIWFCLFLLTQKKNIRITWKHYTTIYVFGDTLSRFPFERTICCMNYFMIEPPSDWIEYYMRSVLFDRRFKSCCEQHLHKSCHSNRFFL